MSHDTSGPAFPQPFQFRYSDGQPIVPSEFHESFAGMTLRDYFAAKALQGTLANSDAEVMRWHDRDAERRDLSPEDSVAQWAYRQADAMLAAREGGAE